MDEQEHTTAGYHGEETANELQTEKLHLCAFIHYTGEQNEESGDRR